MRRVVLYGLVLAGACSLIVSGAIAGGPECHKSAKGAMASASAAESCHKAPGKFPTMVMMVGDKTFSCPYSAEAAAKAANAKVVFAVAGEKYDSKEKAMAALAEAAEDYVTEYLSVACVADGKVLYCDDTGSGCGSKARTASAGSSCHKTGSAAAVAQKSEGTSCSKGKATAVAAKSEGKACCKSKGGTVALTKEEIEKCCKNAKSVKFMVLGHMFDSREEAIKARDAAMKAIDPIHMKFLVDGKEVSDCEKVCPKAKADGKVAFVVNKEKTTCELTARVNLARAKYEAAQKVAEKWSKA